MKFINYRKYLILVFLAVSAKAYSRTLSQPELYARCYAHMVGDRVKKDDALMVQVKSGSLNYVDACMTLLKKANLDSNGIVSSKVGNDPDPVAQRILQTFNNFHNSWFAQQDYNDCSQYEIHDPQEMSYAVSNILFNNKPFSDMVTYPSSFAAIRVSPSNTVNDKYIACDHYLSTSKLKTISNVNIAPSYNEVFRSQAWSPYRPQTGTLIGIKPMPDEDFVPFTLGHNIYDLPDPYENYDQTAPNFATYSKYFNCCSFPAFNKAYVKSPTTIKPHASYGSGVLGAVSYFLLNNGRDFGFKPDGLIQVPRRWSKSVVQDVLCRELPVLRTADVAADVDLNSATPFRAANSCMRCHDTMDPMAYGIRNLTTGRSSVGGTTARADESGASYFSYDGTSTIYDQLAAKHVRKYPVKYAEDSTFLRTTADANFYLKPPVGKFNYRDIYGNLHNYTFTDLSGASSLGNYLKDLDDVYVCAAKRYYEFFTGIDVPIYDFADPTMPPASSDELYHRNFVIKMGKELKASQNVQDLIKEIISSEQYKKQGFGTK
jgi:hypothetical protein